MSVGLSIGLLIGAFVVLIAGSILLLIGKNATDGKDADFVSVIVGIGMYVSGWLILILGVVLGLVSLVCYLWGKLLSSSMAP